MPDGFRRELGAVCELVADETAVAEASRDWWPLALHWALAGQVPAPRRRDVPTGRHRAGRRPCCASATQHGIPVTAAGGRSSVVGGTVPLHGGVLLDLTAMQGVVSVDAVSGIVEVLAGTFGPDLEAELRDRIGLTVGHRPQSMDISTVGGWVACRGAGQYSTRYGKIEDIVSGLEVVLADGTVIRTGGAPRSRGRTRPDPVVRRERGHARRHHAGVAAGAPRSARRTARRVRLRSRSKPGWRPAATSSGAARRRRSCGSTTGRSRPDPTGRTAPVHPPRARRGRTAADRFGDGHRRGLRRRAGRVPPRRRARSSAWMRHRNDTSALQALDPQGFRRRHDGDRRALVAAAGDLRRGAGRAARRAALPSRDLPPVAQLPRRGLPLLHLRRHSPARGGRVDLRRALGCRHASGARPRAATCPTTTAWV